MIDPVERMASHMREAIVAHLSNENYLEHANAQAPLEVVLKLHLWIEGELGNLVKTAVPNPQYLDVDRMTFSAKLKLAAALQCLPPETYEPLTRLNKLRNQLAHNRERAVTQEDEHYLLEAMPPYTRDPIRNIVESAEVRGFAVTLRITLSYLYSLMISMREIAEQGLNRSIDAGEISQPE